MKGLRKTCLVFLWFCLFLSPAGAEYFYAEGDEIAALEHIARRIGKAVPFSSYPVHGSDLLEFAEKLASDPAFPGLAEADIEIFESLIDRLEDRREGILLKGNIDLAYEHRFSSDSFTIDNPYTVPNAEDVRRVFLDFAPIAGFFAGAGTFYGPWVAAQIDVRPAWTDDYSPMSNFLKEADIVYDLLKRGVFAWNGRYLNFFAGRDTVHWGNSQGSTLYASKLLPYLDSVRINVPLGPFSFDYFLGTIMPRRSAHSDVDEAACRDYSGLVDLGDYFGFSKSGPSPSTILAVAHRFQWNFGRVKAGVGGTIIYARSNNQFLITDLLPILIYHNADSVPNNLSLIFDVSWAILPGLNLSVMAGLDDLNARIIGISDGSVPTIPGAVFQLEYSAAGNFFQYYMLEGGYTHYLWGNFAYTDNNDWRGVYLARAIYRYIHFNHSVLLPLTSPYGPGTLWLKLRGDFKFPSRGIRAGAELLFLAKHGGVNLVETPYYADNALDVYNQFYVSLKIPLSYTWKNLTFSVSPGIRTGWSHAAFECTLGLRYALSGRTTLAGPY
jgi:hypothetical protein